MNLKHPKIVILGAGAIGGSVGAWVSGHYDNVFLLDRGEIASALQNRGITTYLEGHKEQGDKVPVRVIQDLREAADADVVAIGVKNYSLEAVARSVREVLGDRPVILAMQNGVENQSILPKYFSRVIYCVIGYNAWIDEPGVIGYQKKGPLIFGTLHNELKEETEALAAVFNRGVETVVVDHLQDAAHSKLIINLTNSLTTLIGLGFRPVSDMAIFQKLLSNLLLEGVQIARAAGFRECKIGGMPPWALMWAGAKLPRFITKGLFQKNVKKMVISSMAQDIIQRGGHDSELETINGYFLKLADRYGIRAPYNRAVYALCRETFARAPFESLDVKEVYERVMKELP